MRTLREVVDIYMSEAYRDGEPSEAIRKEAERIRSLSDDPSRLFEDQRLEHPAPDVVAFRLGNTRYPHMKLVMRRTPEGLVFGVDTHDGPDRIPPDIPGYERFLQVIRENSAIQDRIHRRLMGEIPNSTGTEEPNAGHVLVVDDEPFVGEIMTRLLGSLRFQVQYAASVKEGLQALQKRDFACCFLDIMMPEASGYEFIASLDEGQRKRLPVVFVTGMHPDSIQRKLADAVILKPFTRAMLCTTLKQVGVL